MANTATVTGTIGPGRAITTMVFNDIDTIKFDFNKRTVLIEYDNKILDLTYTGVTIVEFTIDGVSTAIVIS